MKTTVVSMTNRGMRGGVFHPDIARRGTANLLNTPIYKGMFIRKETETDLLATTEGKRKLEAFLGERTTYISMSLIGGETAPPTVTDTVSSDLPATLQRISRVILSGVNAWNDLFISPDHDRPLETRDDSQKYDRKRHMILQPVEYALSRGGQWEDIVPAEKRERVFELVKAWVNSDDESHNNLVGRIAAYLGIVTPEMGRESGVSAEELATYLIGVKHYYPGDAYPFRDEVGAPLPGPRGYINSKTSYPRDPSHGNLRSEEDRKE